MNQYSASKLRLHLPRLLLGCLFIISGINGFLQIFPEPEFSVEGRSFIAQLKASGFWWLLLKTVEIIGGVLLVSRSLGRFGVLLLAPVTIGIVYFHLTYSMQGSAFGFLAFALELIVVIAMRKNLAKLFHADRHGERPQHP